MTHYKQGCVCLMSAFPLGIPPGEGTLADEVSDRSVHVDEGLDKAKMVAGISRTPEPSHSSSIFKSSSTSSIAEQDAYHLKQQSACILLGKLCPALLCPPRPNYIYLDGRSGFSPNYWIHRIQLSLKQNPPPLFRARGKEIRCMIHRWTGDLKTTRRVDTLIMLH